MGLICLLSLPVIAEEKLDMPCLSQEEETCLPTSTANLIVWFGTHGYPNLIQKGDSADDGYIHTVHALMTAVNATYQLGTDTYAITYGIEKYVRNAGYSADVEYRGIDWSMAKFPDVFKDPDEDMYKKSYHTPAPFTQDWLQDNSDPNKGFILLLAYTNYNRETGVFTDAINAGHAVTLVTADPDTILIHDPANDDTYPGRKVLTPTVLTGGTFDLPGYSAPLTGLMILDANSDVMWRPSPDSVILLTGAVCVTMHPNHSDPSIVKGTVGAPNGTVAVAAPGSTAGNGSGSSSSPAAPQSPAATPSRSWAMWLFDMLFKN